jgi:hypothetical protein
MSRDGKKLIQSCYGAGMRIFDVSSVVSGEDPSGDSVCETVFFDVYPKDEPSLRNAPFLNLSRTSPMKRRYTRSSNSYKELACLS